MTLSDLTSKTPEELNVMCAELCGYERQGAERIWWNREQGHYFGAADLPNYTGSWDAIMPEVRKIDYDQQETFTEHLIQVTMNSPHSTYCCCATASPTELTQALILTLTREEGRS